MVQRKLRATAAFMAVLGATTALAGCAGDDTETAIPVTSITVPAVESPWLESFKSIVADYEAESGVDVELAIFPFDGLRTAEATAVQNDTQDFDVLLINEQWTGQFYDNQWVQPLTDIDPEFEWPEGLMELDGIGRWDADTRASSIDGVPYALPINGNMLHLMYRSDLYDQLGLDVPITWEEAAENAEAAVAAGAVAEGWVLRGKDAAYDFTSMLMSYGGAWFADEAAGDFEPTINSPEGREALEMWLRLAQLGPDAPQTIAQAEETSLMQSGQVLQGVFVTAVAAALENPSASTVAGKIDYALVPGGVPLSGGWTMGVPTGLPEDRSQAALDFLNWLTDHDAMEAWAAYGGTTTRTDIDTDRPEIQALIEAASDIKRNFRYTFTPKFLETVNPILGEVVAGTKSVDDALAEMDDRLTEVVTEEGFLE